MSMFFKRYNSSSKQPSSGTPVVMAGDLVIEVNGIVVSPTTIDRVRTMAIGNCVRGESGWHSSHHPHPQLCDPGSKLMWFVCGLSFS